MNNLQPTWLSGFLGVVAPLIVHWIASENLTRKEKSIIAILISAVIGFTSCYLSGQFHTGAILNSTLTVHTISQNIVCR